MTFEETQRLLESEGLRTIVLQGENSGGCLLLAPDLSARIMAVSMDGLDDENFGFVKPEAIANRRGDPQFNAYGGALRWWVGPEGGQFGVALPAGTKNFDLESWHISEEYNGKPFVVAYPQQTIGTSALMGTEIMIENASGTWFHLGVACQIKLLDDPTKKSGKASQTRKGSRQTGLKHFGYLSETTFENLSHEAMTKKTGLVCIWMLGMYVAGPRTYVLAPFERKGTGTIVTDTYFSPDGLSEERLDINKEKGYLVFRTDAKERSKIGLSRSRASTTIRSIDFEKNLLTIWRFPVRPTMPYVNSLWEHQKRPYAGDVSNAYNDGGAFGDFYELECSSHALALKPHERFCFPLEIHHYSGRPKGLLRLADRLLGRALDYSTM